MPRRSDEVSPKQLEVYDLIVNSVRERGFQPTIRELREWLNVKGPAVANRLSYLIDKGMIKRTVHKGERCLSFVGLKFLPYMVNPETGLLEDEQEYTVGDFTVTFRRNKG